MTSKQIIAKIRRQLKAKADPHYKQGRSRFFKEKIIHYGIRTPEVRAIARENFQLVKDWPKKKTFEVCEELLKTGYHEEAGVAFGWASQLIKQYQKSDFRTFERWLRRYVDNWAKCDGFCTNAFARLLIQFPEFLPKIKTWTKSKNRWLRRAAAVCLIRPVITDKKFLKEVFKMADLLLLDQDDMVQKGYGWMLKEASNLYQKEVFDFVMARKDRMPRTALRYAIEKMPQGMRKQAMS